MSAPQRPLTQPHPIEEPPRAPDPGDFGVSALFTEMRADDTVSPVSEPAAPAATAAVENGEVKGIFANTWTASGKTVQQQGAAPMGSVSHRTPRVDAYGMPLRTKRRTALIALAAAAVVAVVGGGIAWSLASVPPSEAAAQQLLMEENKVMIWIRQVNSDIDALGTARSQSVARAEAFATPLAAMAGVSDDAARSVASSARSIYINAASSIVIPEKAERYTRGDIDMSSVDDIEKALEAAKMRATELETLVQDVTLARSTLNSADASFRAALDTFTNSMPTYAEATIAATPNAAEALQAAVLQNAVAVSKTAPFASNRPTVWDTYIASVISMRGSDQQSAGDTEGSGGTADADAVAGDAAVPSATPTPAPSPTGLPGSDS